MNAAATVPATALPAFLQLLHALADIDAEGGTTPCQGDRAGYWTSDNADEREAAAYRCHGCPALTPCTAYADTGAERAHVWAARDLTPTPKGQTR